MPTHEQDPIQEIEMRISAIQQSHIVLQEQVKQVQHHFDRHIDDSALRIIDILDLIDAIQPEMSVNGASPLIIKKIENRLTDILQRWQVQEINVGDNRIAAGKTRIVETRHVSEDTPAGMIIKVCRKGYQRADKTIRPTDVITSVN